MPYTHLTEKDRYVISHLKVAGFSLREIGRRLGRDHATISREIKRNGPTYPEGIYWYDFTQPGSLSGVIKPDIIAGMITVRWLNMLKLKSVSNGLRKLLLLT